MSNRVQLPDKLFFKIGEVSRLAGVKQHVLRYWESEFSSIRPQKSRTNQRLYRRKDVEAVLAIKHLLYDLKFTIEGARKHLKEEGVESSLPPVDPEAVAEVARKEALDSIGEEVARERARAVEWYERRLLGLKDEVKRFLEELGDTSKPSDSRR